MDEERDVVVFEDDDGNEFELDVVEYFEHEGQEYAVLMDLASETGEDDCDCGKCDCDEECDCEDEQAVYIMKVVTNGDTEEFLPADEDKMDELTEIVDKLLNDLYDDEDEEESGK